MVEEEWRHQIKDLDGTGIQVRAVRVVAPEATTVVEIAAPGATTTRLDVQGAMVSLVVGLEDRGATELAARALAVRMAGARATPVTVRGRVTVTDVEVIPKKVLLATATTKL